jgi:hypothetical protein
MRPAGGSEGFLAGSEPSLEQFLGLPADSDESPDDAAVVRWLAAMREYRASGVAPRLNLRPSLPVSAEVAFLEPWMTVGGQIWVWRDGGWRPDPDREVPPDDFLPESICFERSEHLMVLYEPHHLVCEDCGVTAEVDGD